MPKVVEQVLLRKQFTNPKTGKFESIYWGQASPSEATRAKEYIDRLIIYSKLGTTPDTTIQKWLTQLSDEKHQKLSEVGLVKARTRVTLEAYLDSYVNKFLGQKNTYDIYLSSKERLITFFGENCKPESIGVQDAMRYKEYLKTSGRLDGKGGYGQNSIRKKLMHASKFFRAMQAAELIRSNPFEDVKESPADETDRKEYVSAEYCLKAIVRTESRMAFADFALAIRWFSTCLRAVAFAMGGR